MQILEGASWTRSGCVPRSTPNAGDHDFLFRAALRAPRLGTRSLSSPSLVALLPLRGCPDFYLNPLEVALRVFVFPFWSFDFRVTFDYGRCILRAIIRFKGLRFWSICTRCLSSFRSEDSELFLRFISFLFFGRASGREFSRQLAK